MTKIFKTPFATQGDKTVVPVEIQSDGSVSYTQGYGYDYERDQVTDPAAKDIEREKMNSLFHDITESIGEMQLQGFAKWSEAGKPYPIRSVVYHKNKAWQSKIENNNVEPVAGNAWIELKADINANDVGAYSKGDADKRFQPVGKYQAEGYGYSKAESDTKYQPKGNYAPAGNYANKGESYTKAESEGKYQPKGSYQPSGNYATKGESYTKAESDSKYQGKGNYQAAGYSYSKSEADNKYQAKGSYVATTRKVNDKPLSGDVTVTSQDIFNGQAISIGANQNLNNYKTAGIYFQPANANATTNLNYPEAMAGTLIVLKNAGITQLYYVYNTSRIYSRSQYGTGNFTPWAKEFNSQNKPTAGDVGAYSKGESDGKYQPKGNYADKSTSSVQKFNSAFEITSELQVSTNEIRLGFKTIAGIPQLISKNKLGTWRTVSIPDKSGTLALMDDIEIANSIPVGSPIPWPLAKPPAGYLVCNGQAFNKTTYPKLAIAYPSGKLPDLRGEFIRGFDDGRGVDSKRVILSNQEGQAPVSAIRGYWDSTWNNGTQRKTNYSTATGTNNGSWHDIYQETETQRETRPRNISFLYIVRAA